MSHLLHSFKNPSFTKAYPSKRNKVELSNIEAWWTSSCLAELGCVENQVALLNTIQQSFPF